MKFSRAVILAILSIFFVVSTVNSVQFNDDDDDDNAPKAIKALHKKLTNIKNLDKTNREEIFKTFRHNPAIKTLSERVRMAAKNEEIKSTRGTPQYIKGTDFRDSKCTEYGIEMMKYVGCNMADFGTWEAVKFSGAKENNVTFYTYYEPACNGHGSPVKSFIKGECMKDPSTGRYAIWDW